MTVEEAVNVLKQGSLADCEADAKELCDAYEMAIKSLEAWQFVIAEIESFSDSLSSRDEVVEGLTAALDIIENHLKGVNK